MKLLYLHGFRSSPDSDKAVAVAQYCLQNGLNAPIMPQLAISPKDAIRQCEHLIEQHGIDTLCGSSLGGYYAMYLAEKYGLRCAVINPAIRPWEDVAKVENRERYHTEDLNDEATRYLAEVHHFQTPTITQPERYLLLVAMGDEVLNPVLMRSHFKAARQIVVNGGDHSLNDFGGHLGAVMGFLAG